MKIRTIKNFIRKTCGLPVYKTRVEINDVLIFDNGEPLVEIIETEKLKVNKDSHTPLRKSSFPAMTDHKLRKTVYEKLVQASEKLPDGYSLFVFESFRPYEVQLARFDFKVQKLKEQFPGVDEAEIKRRARLGVADPRGGAPHQTGGAVDVTILDKNGVPLPMGTDWAEFNEKTPTKNWHKIGFKKNGHPIMKNRDLLVKIMTGAGFVNYPGEWWHYSYGDRMWTAYTGHTQACYGSVDLDKNKIL